MRDPGHLFSATDHLFLGRNNDFNLKEVEGFRPEDGKLVLVLGRSFKEANLLPVIGALSLSFDGWELRNFGNCFLVQRFT